MRVFPDAVCAIYLVERHPTFGPRVESRLAANPCDLVSSELVRAETLVIPVRRNNQVRVAEFEQFFHARATELVTLDRVVFDRVIDIRGQYGFKMPDAINLAAAVAAGCDVFLTNDHRLTRFAGIRVVLI